MKQLIIILALFFLISPMGVFGAEPGNPGFEDDNILIAPWTVVEKDTFDCGGDGFVVNGADPTEGVNFGQVGCFGYTSSGAKSWGPAFKSETFFAGTGEQFAVDWRVWAGGGQCGDVNSGDDGFGAGYLVDAATDLTVDTFFDTYETPISLCDPPPVWTIGSTATAPLAGDYYLLFQVGSSDATGGSVIGASLDIDNFMTLNNPPDCSLAEASPDMLWPPNHRFHDIAVTGVTDLDGDEVVIEVTLIKQDEPVNWFDDGNTCPDAYGVGTDTASVLAERIGGEFGSEGNGRVYTIYFSATDPYGASCSSMVNVSVPHSKKETAVDDGPLFDSTQCP